MTFKKVIPPLTAGNYVPAPGHDEQNDLLCVMLKNGERIYLRESHGVFRIDQDLASPAMLECIRHWELRFPLLSQATAIAVGRCARFSWVGDSYTWTRSASFATTSPVALFWAERLRETTRSTASGTVLFNTNDN